jgi:hypothetical protein
MNTEEFKQWMLSEIGYRIDRNNIMAHLIKLGFVEIGRGSYKVAFQHPNHSSFVVKVYHDWAHEEEDSQHIPEELSPYFLHPNVCTKNFLIQEFANGIGGTREDAYQVFRTEFPEWGWKYDVHHNNVSYHNGRTVVIDFCS